VRSLREGVRIHTRVCGRRPRTFPMPVRHVERLAPDTATLWRWARTVRLDVDPVETRGVLPDPLIVEVWLRRELISHRRKRVRK
jgi:hypothetical protein